MMRRIIFLILFVASVFNTFARDYFVGGAGASDNNPGTAAQPFATIQKAASVAVAGDVVKIRSGTYRETIVPTNSGAGGNPIVYQPDNGADVIISGLEIMSAGGWSVHNGSIYKKSITLPVNGFNTSTTRIENNTTIFANQIFKDGEMMFEARWPKVSTFADLFDRSKFRQRTSMEIWEPGYLRDNGLPLPAPGLQGATLVSNGWFITETRTITSHSGNQLNHANIWDNTMTGKWSRQRYYVTGKLALLTQAKEWHFENGTLYFWQSGGGSPNGVIEYKARNWGFDLRGKSNTSLVGLKFIGCDPMVGNRSSANTIIDNIRATYMNHHVRHDVGEWQGVGMSKMFGIKLIGANSIIKNSELHSSGSSGVWLGPNCRAENNLMHDMGYVGFWANPISLWDRDGGQVITRNTIYRTGRSCFDFGYNWNGEHLNVEISYNDFSQWGLISQDVGATYAWGQCNLSGLNYHHNWLHDTGAPDAPEVGANVAIYFDQSTGPGTIHHNVTWNCGAADMYHETMNETRHSGAQMNIYNNTFANTGGRYPRSYITYRATPLDNQKNNIYRSQLIFAAGSLGNVLNSLLPVINPQFIGTGSGGLGYRVRAGSPAINAGVVIPGITDGSVGAPDIGAYEFGGPDWTPGYTPQAVVIVPNTKPVVNITAPANNASVTGGTAITITANASDSDGTVSKVEFFNGATKLGEDLTGPYAFTWNNAQAGTHTLTVRATDNQSNVTTSTAISVTVTANTPPIVSISAPVNNAQFVIGVPITITALASDANGTVSKVEFFNGATKVGEDLSSPYSFSWSNAPAGTHTLTAKATDNENNITTSTPISVIVNVGTPPIVSITSPANNAQFIPGAITISAIASDVNGSIAKVEFFAGATKLGEDLTSPYSFVWRNAAVGLHALTAKATDNQSNVTTSATVNINVAAVANANPTVLITGPSNNDQFLTEVPITIAATAADPNGTVTKVEFFAGATKLGEDLTSPYNFVWSNATAGAYALTARATDNQNNVTTSTIVNINVNVPGNANPIVSITGPANNAQFVTGVPISIAATASDPNGTVTKVEFFNETTKIGEDLTAPYNFIWIDVTAGSYAVHAKATDNQNSVSTSPSITISVSDLAADAGEDVLLTLPNNSAKLTAGGTELPDGPQLLYNWVQLDGPSSPIFNPDLKEIDLTNLVEGEYVFELTVTDANGNSDKDAVIISVTSSASASQGTIPRFFTPNGDGFGDFWVWPNDELYHNASLTVYNLSGQQVYESTNYQNTWDGTFEGQPLQAGHYQYVIRLKNSTQIRASVRIIRDKI